MLNKLLKNISLSMALIALSGVATAQIYVWTDPATGKKVYSDQPPPANAKDGQVKNLGGNVVSSGGLPFAVQDAMKRNPVVLYANKCDLCIKAVTLLNNRGIPFSQKNPETEGASAEQLKKLVGSLQVPVLTVGTKVLKGYDEAAWTAALDAAGYPKTSMRGVKSVDDASKPTGSASAGSAPAANKSSSGSAGSSSSSSTTSSSSSSASSSAGSSSAPIKPPGE
ncbi:glutaredoxin family protein [Leeia sp. TBRC 13508]|uniref:Glutaredoxin family protein n=1 Tax=Leeia speluncae TaxID=2884804 RepID=A0ABS8D5C8_9NEIS|nr:glutaredoxin family protein [Leeia speluncae]MCB6183429.1 glutaredoxin family protein [Leeia speluncae]